MDLSAKLDTRYFSYRAIAKRAMNLQAPMCIHFFQGTRHTRSGGMAVVTHTMVI